MKKLLSAVDRIEELFIVIGMGLMVTLNFLNVVCRFLLPQTPFSYTEELVVLLFIWITMFGISYAYKRTAHTGLTLLTDRFGNNGKMAFCFISTAASVIFMIFVIWHGISMTTNQIAHAQILPGMQISSAFQSSALPIGGVVILVRVTQVGIKEIIHLQQGKENKE